LRRLGALLRCNVCKRTTLLAWLCTSWFWDIYSARRSVHMAEYGIHSDSIANGIARKSWLVPACGDIVLFWFQ
jgi:hypothetical protein